MRSLYALVLAALRPRPRAGNRGFSLIELIVVAGIFALLSTVVLAGNMRFGNKIVLENLASDIALSIREAQVYGIAVRRCDPSNPLTTACSSLQESEQFDVAYGMHFCLEGESLSCPESNHYELFVDVDDSATYAPGETVLATTISGGYRITQLCRFPAGSMATECSDSREELNIVFRRPEPDACIEGLFDSDGDCDSEFGRAWIIVESARGDAAKIVVESTGQISVQ